MRTPPLLADFIHHRVCKPICEKLLTLPWFVLSRLYVIRQKNKLDYRRKSQMGKLEYLHLSPAIRPVGGVSLATLYSISRAIL